MIRVIKRLLAMLSIASLLAPSGIALAEEITALAAKPDDPTSLVQSVDGVNPLVVGGIDPIQSIQLKAQVNESLASGETDSLILEAELKKAETAFDFVANYQSDPVSVSGQAVTATVKINGLAEGNYHWQVRVKNKANLVSNWVAFGSNNDLPLPAATDFRVDFPPAAPTNIKASTCEINCPTVHAVNLSWINSSDPDLVGLEVWRSTVAGSSGAKVITVEKSAASLADTGLSEGTIYYYQLRSVDAVGNVSGFSDPAVAVTNIIIEESDGGRVTRTTRWSTAVNGILVAARGSEESITYRPNISTSGVYDIYVNWIVNASVPAPYSTQATGAPYTVSVDGLATTFTVDQTKLADGQPVAGSNVPSGFFKLGTFTLPAGTSSTVRLDASSTGYVVADQSKFVYIRPVPPTNLVATDRPNDNGGAIDLAWTASPSLSVVTYNIYRSSSSGSYDFSKPLASVSGTSFTDSTATTDTTLFYVVRASDRSHESLNSNETSSVAKDNLAPAAPTITSIEAGDGFVVLNWTKVDDAVGYQIRYRDPATEAGFHTMLIDGQAMTSIKITDLSNDVEHELGVAARDAAGNQSGFTTVKATPKGPAPEAIAPKIVTAGLVGKAKAAEIEKPAEQPAAEEGKIKAAEEAREKRQRAAATVAILVVAVAAGIAGYYGYDWWLRQAGQLPKGKGKNGRW